MQCPVCKFPSVCAEVYCASEHTGPFIKQHILSCLLSFLCFCFFICVIPCPQFTNLISSQHGGTHYTSVYLYLFSLGACVICCFFFCFLRPRIRFTCHAPPGSRASPLAVKVKRMKTTRHTILRKKERKRERENDNFPSSLFGVSCCCCSWMMSTGLVPSFYTYSHGSFVYYTHRTSSVVRCCCKNKRRDTRRRQRGNEREWGKLIEGRRRRRRRRLGP